MDDALVVSRGERLGECGGDLEDPFHGEPALGEIDAAFEVLERAEEECQANLYFTGLPVFDPLRGDPRFTALLQRLGLPPEGRS